MPGVVFERRLVKSPPEVWHRIRSQVILSHWLGDVQLRSIDPPHRLEWDAPGASGVIKLESSGWGTTVRVEAEPYPGPAWERLRKRYTLERCLCQLLDELGTSTLKRP
jgi:hypothetical protein